MLFPDDSKEGSVTFRPLTADEQELVSVLLSKPFPGRDAMVKQIEDALVRPIDGDGSLEFQVPNHPLPTCCIEFR